MIRSIQDGKIEYGDFQTPLELATLVCQKLVELGVNPDTIIEPTCGVGNFLHAATLLLKSTNKIFGFEINQKYLEEVSKLDLQSNREIEIKIQQADFFKFNWFSLLEKIQGEILVLGNFPWVTNSQQGTIESINLPIKTNFQKHRGLDAITGKSNFDISEWMLIQVVHWLQGRDACLAMLCKMTVARKILNYIYHHKLHLASCQIYRIDTKKYFNANVEACLLFCKFNSTSINYFCDVFDCLNSSASYRIGYHNNLLIKDLLTFEKSSHLYDRKRQVKWRSGIKHDCSKVMELHRINSALVNGLGETVEIEEDYLFPLFKGSDVAQNRIETTEKFLLVPQREIGDPTEKIKQVAPKTWDYLQSHSPYLDSRKSKIYKNNPKFSIFGVGSYTFSPWKIAICGLYKTLSFRLIGEIYNKPVVFDDTVYFLSFEDLSMAEKTLNFLNSPASIAFYSSLIFWDEKRPIKSSILNSLNLSSIGEILLHKG